MLCLLIMKDRNYYKLGQLCMIKNWRNCFSKAGQVIVRKHGSLCYKETQFLLKSRANIIKQRNNCKIKDKYWIWILLLSPIVQNATNNVRTETESHLFIWFYSDDIWTKGLCCIFVNRFFNPFLLTNLVY